MPTILGYTLFVAVAVLSGMAVGPIRLLISVPLLFFVPGYALLSALFPGDRIKPTWAHRTSRPSRWSDGIGWVERLSLSVATSLAILAVGGVLVSAVGLVLSTDVLVLSSCLVTIIGMGVGWHRRLNLPPEARLGVPVDDWLDELRSGLWGAPNPADAWLNLLVAVAIAIAVASLVAGLAVPEHGEAYTEAALLSTDGDTLVAGNYSTDLEPGEPFNATFTVENQLGAEQAYTLVVRVERVRVESDQAVVTEQQALLTDEFEVADGVVRRSETSVQPTLVGEDLRLSYYLFLDEPPGTVSAETADEHLFLWIDVETAGAAGNATAQQRLPAPHIG